MVIVDLLDQGQDENDLANAPEGQDRTWNITDYLLQESNAEYDERHALSQALKGWKLDSVSRIDGPNPDPFLARNNSTASLVALQSGVSISLILQGIPASLS